MGFQGTGKAKIKKFMYHTLTLHFRRCTIMMQALGEGRSRNRAASFCMCHNGPVFVSSARWDAQRDSVWGGSASYEQITRG